MICRFCNEEVGDNYKFCPYCGKTLCDDAEVISPTTESAEEVAADEIAAETVVKKRKIWPFIVGGIGSVILLGLLAVLLLYAFGVDLRPKPNDIHKKEVYTVSDEQVEKKSNKVVATMGGKELTNTQLQIFYRMQVVDFVNYYGQYLSYVGLDISKPLDQQMCAYDEELTWEQYFLDVALETWQNYQAMELLAEESGFTLSEEWQTALDEMPAELEAEAASGGYESADELIRDAIGPSCDLEDYLQYIRLAFLRNDYYASQYELLMPSDADVEAYFTDHAAEYEQNGITKESGLYASVRHILVIPEGGTTSEDGETTYSEEEWAACLAKAEGIYEEWKTGDATEESFAALANQYSEDGGSNTNGGLYEGIYLNSGMTENFQNWAIDMHRQTGDTQIVQTEFGYHIMYFVSGVPNWFNTAQTNLLSERTTEMIEAAEEKWPMKVSYGKIVLAELDF